MNESPIKLTPRQKQVIAKMRSGWLMHADQAFGVLLAKGRDYETLNHKLYYSLLRKGLIQDSDFGRELSELGKTVRL